MPRGYYILLLLIPMYLQAQKPVVGSSGSITGNLMDSAGKFISSATIKLTSLTKNGQTKTALSKEEGSFTFINLELGYYRLEVSVLGFTSKTVDSIWLRNNKPDIVLSDLLMGNNPTLMQEFVVYAEKPLIQNKEGNLTFNASESPLANGSNASELLRNVPLVSNDPNGKLTVKGKEPKVLIDDKPVELNAQQLQELLESLPGSMIEKIEVMTNPPPQYQNEPGGVINIVTKKGKVGISGRLSWSMGTLGDLGMNGSYNYRRKGLSFSMSAGGSQGLYRGEGYSKRQNIYSDSSNYFNTESNYKNFSIRPYYRFNLDWDPDKSNSLSISFLYSQSNANNKSGVWYTNLNRFSQIYRLSNRDVLTGLDNYAPSLNLSYLHKGKKPGVNFRAWLALNFSGNFSDREFNQHFYFPDKTPNGIDSFQLQETDTRVSGYSVRISNDIPFPNKKTSFSYGGYYTGSYNHVLVNTNYMRKPDSLLVRNELLSNDFLFNQQLTNFRMSLSQKIAKKSSISIGVNVENTDLIFEVYKQNLNASNNYWNLLPYLNFNKTWKEHYNVTISYRRTIARPGIYQLNPSVEYGDPYNLRFGNPQLSASTSHTIDVVAGASNDKYYCNFGIGHNIVQNAFAQIRSLQPDGKTFITWQNIDDRKEYEISNWSGYNFSNKFRMNLSASYSYHVYSAKDRMMLRYRNGGTVTSNLNSSYVPNDLWNMTGSITFNRFGNPQGFVKWNTSLNVGMQRKILRKKISLSLNLIDPLLDQKNRVYTYGPNFNHESYSLTRTSNYRISISYNFVGKPKKTTPLDKILNKK